MWVRGLKQYLTAYLKNGKCVAPRVGAWIETQQTEQLRQEFEVAPRVGAWIET